MKSRSRDGLAAKGLLRAQLEPISCNGRRKNRKFIAIFHYLNSRYIQFYLHRRLFYTKISYSLSKNAGKKISISVELAL